MNSAVVTLICTPRPPPLNLSREGYGFLLDQQMGIREALQHSESLSATTSTRAQQMAFSRARDRVAAAWNSTCKDSQRPPSAEKVDFYSASESWKARECCLDLIEENPEVVVEVGGGRRLRPTSAGRHVGGLRGHALILTRYCSNTTLQVPYWGLYVLQFVYGYYPDMEESSRRLKAALQFRREHELNELNLKSIVTDSGPEDGLSASFGDDSSRGSRADCQNHDHRKPLCRRHLACQTSMCQPALRKRSRLAQANALARSV